MEASIRRLLRSSWHRRAVRSDRKAQAALPEGPYEGTCELATAAAAAAHAPHHLGHFAKVHAATLHVLRHLLRLRTCRAEARAQHGLERGQRHMRAARHGLVEQTRALFARGQREAHRCVRTPAP